MSNWDAPVSMLSLSVQSRQILQQETRHGLSNPRPHRGLQVSPSAP
jgi:hypothetical protein